MRPRYRNLQCTLGRLLPPDVGEVKVAHGFGMQGIFEIGNILGQRLFVLEVSYHLFNGMGGYDGQPVNQGCSRAILFRYNEI